ncbi:chromosome partitioning protein ParA [Vibrio tetraodonis]|uniref:chromosome partitioning protein ParA n=1 Tax=Vibrio tetraodonis TaxID=2231647 RepID=UPI000E0A161D|nr:chromosome partitioning protein ParA [Vibrio tetraodonis]
MNYRAILFVLAVVASIYLWPEEERLVDSASEKPSQEVGKAPQRLVKPIASQESNIEGAPVKNAEIDRSITQLNQSQGRELVNAIEQFWADCLGKGDCLSQLAALKSTLSVSRYQLLVNYNHFNREWQSVWQESELNHFTLLSDKVTDFKRLATLVWGEHATLIFADEFALYDFSLEQDSLSESLAADFLNDYQTLLIKWREKEAVLTLEADSEKYEQGVSLIPSSYPPDKVREIKHQLARQYLTEKEIASIASREQQVAQQNAHIGQYQDELVALNQILEAQRQSTSLSDSEWQTYVEQQVSQFRRDYFSYQ